MTIRRRQVGDLPETDEFDCPHPGCILLVTDGKHDGEHVIDFCIKSTEGEPRDFFCGRAAGHAGPCRYTRPREASNGC